MDTLKKINSILFFIVVVYILFYYGSSFFIPLVFGVFFASLMTPFANLLEKIKIPRVLSAFASTLIIFVVVGSILYLVLHQLTLFLSDISQIRRELQALIDTAQTYITNITNLSLEEQKQIWQERSGQILTTMETQLTRFLGEVAHTGFNFLVVLVYVFLFVYYRKKFFNFVMMYTSQEKKEKNRKVLEKISKVVYHYLWGRAKVMALLAIMYYITLLIFDIPFALLLTLFGALVTIIPYVGPFVSGVLPIIFGIIYLDHISIMALFIAIIITIQLVESYVFEPLIIGKEVKLNPLMVIIAIIMGGMVWGLAGMVLFVPMFAMFKIVAMHTPGLQPVGILLGSSKEHLPEESISPGYDKEDTHHTGQQNKSTQK